MTRREHQLTIAGLSLITSNDEAITDNSIGKLWADFLNLPLKEQLKPHTISDSVFAVYSDYENAHMGKYKITLGYAVKDDTKPHNSLSTVIIPAGNYQSFPAKSSAPQDIIATWATIWSMDSNALPRTYLADFEEYSEQGVLIQIGCK